jgi:hypothetical protein
VVDCELVLDAEAGRQNSVPSTESQRPVQVPLDDEDSIRRPNPEQEKPVDIPVEE